MTFIWPWMLLTLLAVPLLVGATVVLQRRRRPADDLGPLRDLRDRAGRRPGRRHQLPGLLSLVGLTLLCVGLARPEMAVDLPRVSGTVILAIDVSNSMAADDLEPTRMEAAKVAARTFVERQPSTVQIGVVAFSSGGLVLHAPTTDQAALATAIERLEPQGATSLAQGIFNALNAIAGEPLAIDPEALEAGAPVEIGSYPSAVVLLLTDGENTASPDPLVVAQVAAQAGVRIYTVGIGTPEGAVLQLDGYNVLSQLDEAALTQIADLTNGAYYRAADAAALEEIYRNVDLQLTVSGDTMEVTALVAGLSLLFLLAGAILSMLWFGRMPL